MPACAESPGAKPTVTDASRGVGQGKEGVVVQYMNYFLFSCTEGRDKAVMFKQCDYNALACDWSVVGRLVLDWLVVSDDRTYLLHVCFRYIDVGVHSLKVLLRPVRLFTVSLEPPFTLRGEQSHSSFRCHLYSMAYSSLI